MDGKGMNQSHSHARSRQVPALARAQPKVCSRCKLWFAARPRERTCDNCLPRKARNKRFAADAHWATKTGLKLPGAAGQKARKTRSQGPGLATESALLGVTFTRPVKICHGLALEAAACLDQKRPKNAWKSDPLAPRVPVRPLPGLDPGLARAHRYAVSQGLQGCGGCQYCEPAHAA